MERFTVSMNSDDIDLFERKRSELGMSKSSYIRFLIAEHENKVPSFLKHKEIIAGLSSVNTTMKEILINENIDSTSKMTLYEIINSLNETIRSKL